MKPTELTLINPVNFIAVDNQNRILLAKRAKDSWNALGKWCIPGGNVENGETFEDAIAREIREELNCELMGMKYFKSYFLQWDAVSARSVYFYGGLAGDVKLQLDELLAYKWFDLSDPQLLELDYAFDQKKVTADFVKFWKDHKKL